nr:serine/threonine-protein kinase TOUSLED isoform X1 [Ipomoea batatas]
MSDDLMLHFSSNSSNQSDNSKMAKLEARMVRKPASAPQPVSWPSAAKFGDAETLREPVVSSDSDDDDNGGEFLIQANTSKRRRLEEDTSLIAYGNVEAVANTGKKSIEITDTGKVGSEENRRRQSRGRGSSATGRGRGSRNGDQTKVPMLSPSNGQLENSNHMELKTLKDNEKQMKPKITKIISELLISVSKAERHEARMKVRQDSLRLGNVGVIRAGTVISEAWEDSELVKDLNVQLRNLAESKESLERQRKSKKKRHLDKSDVVDEEAGNHEEDYFSQDEYYRSRLASIKREEEMMLRERDRLELEKILNRRYALLNLLGKGGFSEVYKAFDLIEHRYVACKLHGLNAQWSEDKKQSYIRHAIREYNIHKTLVHINIVRLWDIFEIDQNTFCTVLEYCSGKDLDAILKATPVLSEFEARYLPPECFELGKTPLISSKVDVWSAGILLYQMLFGKRPFGHDQTQERILREDTIIKARKVEFPSRPAISSEAKDFIRRCLTYNQAERPDVLAIAQDPYLNFQKK